jgi:radical SAM superfamily enzyme YgiQ (UPF0313 family)
MRILLVQHSEKNRETYPLGLGYVAAVLQKAGHTVAFSDLGLSDGEPATRLLQEAEAADAQALGFTVQTPQYNEFLDLMRKTKPQLPGMPIVIGGAHASVLSEEVLRDGAADITVIGEGEGIAPELFKTLEEDGDLRAVPGIAFLDDDGKFVQTPPSEQVADLDTIPFPPWDIFHPERYRGHIRGLRTANIMTSRGCPYNCTHCYRGPSGGRRYRKRSIENVLEEIRRLHLHHGIGSFRFVDDMFTVDMDRTREFCDALRAEKFQVFWNCQTRVASIDRDLLKKMKQAGCTCVSLGIESGSDHIREKLRKKTSEDQIKRALSHCHEVGMPSTAFFMIGTPWETPQTIEETISLAKKLRATRTAFFLATPFPGTELREEFSKMGWPVPSDYSDYRHYVEGKEFASRAADDSDEDPRNFFIAECRRAAKEVVLSQLSGVRYYPQLLREFSHKYSFGEFTAFAKRRLRLVA